MRKQQASGRSQLGQVIPMMDIRWDRDMGAITKDIVDERGEIRSRANLEKDPDAILVHGLDRLAESYGQ